MAGAQGIKPIGMYSISGIAQAPEGWLSGNLRYGIWRQKPPILPDHRGRNGTAESVQDRVEAVFHQDCEIICGERCVMDRKEFMERLERLLWNISDSEREEALQYYNDYFDDAGVENESRVIEELGGPEQVAQKIKAGCSDAASEYSEQGYEDTRFRETREVISRNRGRGGKDVYKRG